jgi:hypothetical protein
MATAVSAAGVAAALWMVRRVPIKRGDCARIQPQTIAAAASIVAPRASR